MTTTPPKKLPRPRRKTAAAPEVSPRVARRERRRERSREEIIDAARRVLLEKGIAATTLGAVAKEVGLTKAALYYYFPSKDALLFEITYSAIEAQSRAIHAAVEATDDGGAALGCILRETVALFAPRLDDFRLAYLLPQVGGPCAMQVAAQQLERVRPLNDLAYGGAAAKLAKQWSDAPGGAGVSPRLMAFLAGTSAIGLLTMKGMVESVGDPLVYSDDELVEGLARIFDAAARS